jgi:hypothetical protein
VIRSVVFGGSEPVPKSVFVRWLCTLALNLWLSKADGEWDKWRIAHETDGNG